MWYYSGGFYGGEFEPVMKMCEEIAAGIERDFAMDIPYLGLWQVESYINKYFWDNPPAVILSPSCIFHPYK